MPETYYPYYGGRGTVNHRNYTTITGDEGGIYFAEKGETVFKFPHEANAKALIKYQTMEINCFKSRLEDYATGSDILLSTTREGPLMPLVDKVKIDFDILVKDHGGIRLITKDWMCSHALVHEGRLIQVYGYSYEGIDWTVEV